MRHLKATGLAKVRACADDLGMAIRSLKTLTIVKYWFDRFQKVSGLTLKPQKCIVILLNVHAGDVNVDAVKDWLSRMCSEWRDFKITDKGTYLGVFL